MKSIISLILVVVFLTGCEITGKAVQELEDPQTQDQRDTSNLEKAIAEKDISVCYNMQTQNIRELCFVRLAQELKDPSICNNLLGTSLRNSCKAGIQ